MIVFAAAAQGSDLVVHEWGTFTAVAGVDGAPIVWHPLAVRSDLPDFVYGAAHAQDGLRTVQATKGDPARVRMETPVVYFYTKSEQTVDVSVRFVDGAITEWYPRAREYSGAGVDWGQVRLIPHSPAELPHPPGASHYYAARDVDSADVRVCDPRGDQVERFLFYRGLGQFPLAVRATATDRDLRLWTDGRAPSSVVVFERRGDRVGFAKTAPGGTVPRPALDDTEEAVSEALRGMLVEAGLYGPEADAMLATWDGDWFEDGLRVLYVVPRAETDARLPLTLTPKPHELVRVLVGRLEVPTPEVRTELAALLDGPGTDPEVLAAVDRRFGRFAEPWLAESGHPRAAALVGSGVVGAD